MSHIAVNIPFIFANSLFFNWKATLFLIIIALVGVTAFVLFFMSIHDQKKYETEELPSLPGDEEIEEEEGEDESYAFDIEEALPDLGDISRGSDDGEAESEQSRQKILFGRR